MSLKEYACYYTLGLINLAVWYDVYQLVSCMYYSENINEEKHICM